MPDPGDAHLLTVVEGGEEELQLGVLHGGGRQHVHPQRCHAPLHTLAHVPDRALAGPPQGEVLGEAGLGIAEVAAPEESFVPQPRPSMAFPGPPAWQSAHALPMGPFLLQRLPAPSARSTAGLFVGSRLSPKPTGLTRVSGFRAGSCSGSTGPFRGFRNATMWTSSSGLKTPVVPHGGIDVLGEKFRESYTWAKMKSSGRFRSP